ncbi:MAG: NAD(P)-binding protein [bacterium]|nr:NAD(P)-binding protein [bacterium]
MRSAGAPRCRGSRAAQVTRVLVVGAGVVGLAAAHRLRVLGREVEVLEAAVRAGGQFANQPLCVASPEVRGLLGGLGLEKQPPMTAVQQRLASVSMPQRAGERWRRLATRWREVFASRRGVAELAVSSAAPGELVAGVALVDALAAGLPIRFGWEVIDTTGSATAVTVHYVAPSGERTTAADAVLLTQPIGKALHGERQMAVFFEVAHPEPSEEPLALHETPPPASGATDVWTLHAPGHTTIRIDLSDEASRKYWDLADEEVGASLRDLLPSDIRPADSRPAVRRITGPGVLPDEDPQDGPHIVRARAPRAGLASALATGIEAAERLE